MSLVSCCLFTAAAINEIKVRKSRQGDINQVCAAALNPKMLLVHVKLTKALLASASPKATNASEVAGGLPASNQANSEPGIAVRLAAVAAECNC